MKTLIAILAMLRLGSFSFRSRLTADVGRDRDLKCSVVRLETASVLKEAIALYKRYGFEPVAPEHLSVRSGIQ